MNTNKYIKYVSQALALMIVCVMSSCDFLDKEPTLTTSGNYFKNTTEAESFLKGVYAILTQTSYFGNEYFYLVGGDDTEHYGGAGRAPYAKGLICNNANTSDADVAGFWYTLYAGINRANIFIESVDDVPDMSEEQSARLKAEARFLRAFYYFNLVECWGDVPFTTSSTRTVNGLAIGRTDKEAIYDFIEKEMSESAEALPSAADLNYLPGRVSRSTAWGMLARVLMFRAGEHFRDHQRADASKEGEYFARAGQYAQRVMGEGHSLAPHYWDFFIDLCSNEYNTTGNESIWEAEFAGNYTTDTRTEGRVGNIIGISAPDESGDASIVGRADPGYGYGFFYCTPKLFDLYESNGDIERMNWNIAPFQYTESRSGKGVDGRLFEVGKLAEVKQQYYSRSFSYGDSEVGATKGDREKATVNVDKSRVCGKYRREYEGDKKNKNYTSINFPLLRYSDVLLMVAECENEINAQPTALAYECINAVRGRAGIARLTGLTKEEFRQAVKDERAMELCFECTRRFDLIRWGEYVSAMNGLVRRALEGSDWKLGPTNVYTYFQISESYLYFPIPANEIAVNNRITQNNPGW